MAGVKMFQRLRVDDGLELVQLWTRTSKALGYSTWVPVLGDGLVDSGFPHAGPALLTALARQTIRRVVHTHSHEDHIGNDFLLQSSHGTELLAPGSALDAVQSPSGFHYFPYERIVWGVPQGVRRVEALPSKVTLGPTELEVIPTPGHCPEHVIFFDASRGRVFSGDLFLSVKVKVARPQENSVQQIDSLKKVITLQPRQLICTHRGLIQDPMPLLEAKLRFLEETLDKVRLLNAKGWPVPKIARHLLGLDSPAMMLGTSGDVTKANFVRSFLKEATTTN